MLVAQLAPSPVPVWWCFPLLIKNEEKLQEQHFVVYLDLRI